MKTFVCLALALGLTCCLPLEQLLLGLPTCRRGDTQCAGNVAQVCGADLHWKDIECCDHVGSGGRWQCEPFEGVHACLPVAKDAGDTKSSR